MASAEFSSVLESVNKGLPSQIKRTYEGTTFIRQFIPEDRLILLGGGHIAKMVSVIAALADFSVTVVDDREDFANKNRFPDATRIICSSFEDALSNIDIRPGDYVCIMTREHKYDRTCLRELLKKEAWPKYLGMVGSKKRVAALFDLLEQEGYDRTRIDSICAPVGLPINGLTPAEIAVSIVAEMISKRRPQKLHEEINDMLVQTTTDLSLLTFLADSSKPKALILVIRSEGSTPVKSGAVMAVDEDGKIYGTIGGGIGEAQALETARKIIGTNSRTVTTVNMINEVTVEDGMACGGTMQVLIEDMK